ncbi:MAG: hypothetical protein EXQ87_01025 [Alphaproteobacteria bacterium]|nr:hypothetical protein [Alphaproteobacteria bacterium]
MLAAVRAGMPVYVKAFDELATAITERNKIRADVLDKDGTLIIEKADAVKATEEIASQINALQGATADSVQAIEGISKTINEMHEISTSIASAVQEQTMATREISHSVQQASAGTSEVSANIGGVTQAAGELSVQSEKLRAEVGTFLAAIRAA